MKKPNLEFWM